MNKKNKFFFIFSILLSGAKAFFESITQIAWGIASLFFLSITMFYLRENYEVNIAYITPIFAKLTTFLVENIIWFVLVLFIISFILELRKLNHEIQT